MRKKLKTRQSCQYFNMDVNYESIDSIHDSNIDHNLCNGEKTFVKKSMSHDDDDDNPVVSFVSFGR